MRHFLTAYVIKHAFESNSDDFLQPMNLTFAVELTRSAYPLVLLFLARFPLTFAQQRGEDSFSELLMRPLIERSHRRAIRKKVRVVTTRSRNLYAADQTHREHALL